MMINKIDWNSVAVQFSCRPDLDYKSTDIKIYINIIIILFYIYIYPYPYPYPYP